MTQRPGAAAGAAGPARDPDAGARKKTRGGVVVRVEEMASVALTLLILFAVSLQIFFRYVLRSPLIWTDELARFGVIWLTFVSAAFVAARQGHVAIEFMDQLLGPRRVRYVKILARILVLVTCAIMVAGSYAPVEMAGRRMSTALGVPLWVPAVAAPVGFALIGYHCLRSLVRLVRGESVAEQSSRSAF